MAESIVRAESLTQQVYRYLRDELVQGVFAPGLRIVETKIAASLRVSRGPVREALRQLVAEQLLREERGVITAFAPTFEDFQELYQLRAAVESMAAELAAGRSPSEWAAFPEWTVSFEENLRDSRVAMDLQDAEALVERNADFHRSILVLSGNRRFQHTMSSVSALIQCYWHQVARAVQWPTDMVAEHTQIYEAVRMGDGGAAARIMRSHIERDLDVMARAYR